MKREFLKVNIWSAAENEGEAPSLRPAFIPVDTIQYVIFQFGYWAIYTNYLPPNGFYKCEAHPMWSYYWSRVLWLAFAVGLNFAVWGFLGWCVLQGLF